MKPLDTVAGQHSVRQFSPEGILSIHEEQTHGNNEVHALTVANLWTVHTEGQQYFL